MIIRLDKITCADFLSQGVKNVNIDIVQAGCAGSKISVTPRVVDDERISSDPHNDIRGWVVPELVEKLDGAQIARAKGKYFLVSKKIQARCGCGTSFSFERKKVSQDLAKIHRIQNALKSSPEIQQFQHLIQSNRREN